jgi:hypothetical protein
MVLSKLPTGKIEGKDMRRENNSYKEDALFAEYTEGMAELFTLEKERAVYSWINQEQLPFEKIKNNRQIDLFTEQEYVILMIKIAVNVIEGEIIDVYYLFFREDTSNFGISRIEGFLDTTQKAFLGSLLSKIIPFIYNLSDSKDTNFIEDTIVKDANFIEVTNVCKQLIKQIEQLKQNDTKTPLLKMMRQWSDDLLKNYPRPLGVNLHLSEQALEILAAKGDFLIVRKTLEQAVSYALLLHAADKQQDIEITSAYLLFENQEKEEVKAPIIENTITSKKLKVMQMLDNLEMATVKLLEKGGDLTGINVGKTMDKPISAAAISEYLKTNERYVGILIGEYPKRWKTIGTKFRPFTNVIERLADKKIAV